MKRTIRAVGTVAVSALVAGVLVGAPPASADDVDVAPARKITGATTSPFGLAKDAAGRIYVSNFSQNNVVVYAAGANGAAAPTRTMNSGVNSPRGVDVDSNGFTYVANGNGLVSVFAPTADLGDPPVKTFGTGAGAALGLDVGPTGSIFVRKSTTVNVYSPAAAGNPAPTTRQITGLPNGNGVHVAQNGTTWADAGAALRAYAPNANGAAIPLRTISGAKTGLTAPVVGLGTDAAGRIYATNFNVVSTAVVFAADAQDNVAPLKVLGGPASQLNDPSHIAVSGSGRLTVANFGAQSVLEFATLFVKAPSKPRALKVKGKKRAKKRTITWKAPADNGGAQITGYRLVIKKGSKVLVKKNFGPGKRSFKVKRAKLRNGKNVVFIKAKNSQGFGKNAKKAFRVRK
ncbi:hypothetical protein FE697_017160 [Mumia zhuanghuii]|uniref:Fibronectin type-III domain-containing protein n=2 Tax=Mumia TaxID=1546255 RepID=A0ABW1QMF9_9ACTN|nr:MULTISPECIES: hypothetical protein [Mumia]KAA1420672.1 hypothetical protein FE697_017160 [Mumia zhuanghuii]